MNQNNYGLILLIGATFQSITILMFSQEISETLEKHTFLGEKAWVTCVLLSLLSTIYIYAKVIRQMAQKSNNKK